MNVNLRGTFFCCQEALRIMYSQGSGAIVNTPADDAFNPISGFSLQAEGKDGLVNLTQTLALEEARWGYRVKEVSQGICRTQTTEIGRDSCRERACMRVLKSEG